MRGNILIWATCFCTVLSAQAGAKQFFTNTTTTGKIRVQHFVDFGFTLQQGPAYTRTWNSYTRTIDGYNNNLVPRQTRFFSVHAGHLVSFKKKVDAGFTYGLDWAYMPCVNTLLVPLQVAVAKNIPMAKRLAAVIKGQAGYAFFYSNAMSNQFESYKGLTGGFTGSINAGLLLATTPKCGLRILAGYRLQHLHSTMHLQYSGPAPSILPALASGVTEKCEAFYNCMYFALGVAF